MCFERGVGLYIYGKGKTSMSRLSLTPEASSARTSACNADGRECGGGSRMGPHDGAAGGVGCEGVERLSLALQRGRRAG